MFAPSAELEQALKMVNNDIQKATIKSTTLKSKAEQSSLISSIQKGKKALEGPDVDKFLQRYMSGALYLSEKLVPLQVMDSAIRQLSSEFSIATSRTFIKHKETQKLVLALNYNSWMPFLSHLSVDKKKKEFTISFDRITYEDKNSTEVTIDKPFHKTFSFSNKNHQNCEAKAENERVHLPSLMSQDRLKEVIENFDTFIRSLPTPISVF